MALFAILLSITALVVSALSIYTIHDYCATTTNELSALKRKLSEQVARLEGLMQFNERRDPTVIDLQAKSQGAVDD